MARTLRIAYLMDPLGGIDIEKDTTFAFLLESQSRGHLNFVMGPADLAIRRGIPEAIVKQVCSGYNFRLVSLVAGLEGGRSNSFRVTCSQDNN